MVKYMAVAVTVAVAVSGGGAVAVEVPVAGLTKKLFNRIQKDFLIIGVTGPGPPRLMAGWAGPP